MVRKYALGTALALSLFAAPQLASATLFDALIVFGDSLSDGGNVYNATLAATSGALKFPPPPYNQRVTNGLTAVEYLAKDYLGYQLAPSTAGAPGNTNYAYAGATTGYYDIGGGVTTSNFLDADRGLVWLRGTGLPGQLQTFRSSQPSFNADTTLFVLWAGANDFFLAPEASTIGTAVNNLSDALQTLVVEGGARNILVPNMPNLGITPDALSDGAGAALTLASQVFNANLASALGTMEHNLQQLYPDLDIIAFDTFGALGAVLADPGAFGLANVTQPCLDLAAGTLCEDPDTYLFWDGVHPTDAVHRILAGEFAAAVPEPQVYVFLAIGVLVLSVVRRRRMR